MKEGMRNCVHIMMVPIWRRKYFLVSGGLVWVVFYLYLHYIGGSEKQLDANGEGGVVSLTTGSLSAKLPVDMALVQSEQESRLTSMSGVKNKRNGPEYIEANNKEFVISETKSSGKLSNGINNKKDFDFSKAAVLEGEVLNGAKDLKSDENEGINAHIQNSNNNGNYFRSSPTVAAREESAKKRMFANGLKPTSILIKPLEKGAPYIHQNNTQGSTKNIPYVPSLRFVHLDLKGAPPKVSYLKAIFPLIKAAGANGIIIEYEDTFPFWGPLAAIAAKNAYKKIDIRHILEVAKINKLQVVPLVQTFGHLEFVLKLKEFRHLREVDEYPQALCPTNNGSLAMVKTMIDQVMSLHPESKWLHIGSDEVYQLGHCKRCSRYDRNSLFLAYVRKVARYVKENYKVIPIMWDDMLRHISITEMEKYDLGQLVEPMAWSYVEDIYLFLSDSLWEKYSKVFPTVWAASAFKGAFGETLTVPDAKRHLENNKAWLSVMTEQHKNFESFRGIAITGWQRYDHFASLCELLPAGLPSLIMNLLTLSEGGFNVNVFPKMQQILECSSRRHYHLDLEHDPYLWRALGVCFFPGSAVFRLSLRHNDVTRSVDKYIYDTTIHKGWMTEYNVNHNFSSPLRVNELLREFSYHNSSLQMLQDAAMKALREMFDEYTVNEWIELNIYPYVKKMRKLWNTGMKLKSLNVWPQRPFRKTVNLPPPGTDFGFIKS